MRRLAAAIAAFVVAAAGCGREDADRNGTPSIATLDPGPVHVHALGVDPADGGLYLATHTGLFRLPKGSQTATRVAGRFQDTMGFGVLGPRHFIGSGHPDMQEARERNLPPLLGLLESTDAGRTWRSISLLGAADFHVLRVDGSRIYGYDASGDRLLVSDDGGGTWQERARPAPLLDLAVDPATPNHLLASSELGVHESRDGGASWTDLDRPPALLAWPAPGHVISVALDGQVRTAVDPDSSPELVGDVGGTPAALLATSERDLYVALHDGTVVRSTDGGATWIVRYRPAGMP